MTRRFSVPISAELVLTLDPVQLRMLDRAIGTQRGAGQLSAFGAQAIAAIGEWTLNLELHAPTQTASVYRGSVHGRIILLMVAPGPDSPHRGAGKREALSVDMLCLFLETLRFTAFQYTPTHRAY